ncbi:hypothetical protein RF11_08308 [Thelohanellus kitauei]|uniref:Transmembrane protein n=1 Tax=Thelohanellus kitauei TaxID=669202 RepID=A0A0C2N5P8_THEKT|nr:hypothetical protein RF11_08308 [Thelohanellus kitauei]
MKLLVYSVLGFVVVPTLINFAASSFALSYQADLCKNIGIFQISLLTSVPAALCFVVLILGIVTLTFRSHGLALIYLTFYGMMCFIYLIFLFYGILMYSEFVENLDDCENIKLLEITWHIFSLWFTPEV